MKIEGWDLIFFEHLVHFVHNLGNSRTNNSMEPSSFLEPPFSKSSYPSCIAEVMHHDLEPSTLFLPFDIYLTLYPSL